VTPYSAGVARFEDLRRELDLSAPADPDSVARLRKDYGTQVPDDYLAFLAQHDGASGASADLFPAAEVGLGRSAIQDSTT